jgi:uncharacterized protein
MRITCNPAKRQRTLQERGLDMRRAKEIFAGYHFRRVDDRFDYGEPRFTTVGWPIQDWSYSFGPHAGTARRIVSMRHCHEREAKTLRQFLPQG